jgi:hypothetical protein
MIAALTLIAAPQFAPAAPSEDRSADTAELMPLAAEADHAYASRDLVPLDRLTANSLAPSATSTPSAKSTSTPAPSSATSAKSASSTSTTTKADKYKLGRNHQ